ncbi:Glutathionyl-hydroquinone reductase yqjg, partial [Globisporangium splendens]
MASLRNFIQNSPGARYPPEKDRYHLYVSLACPFACRVVAVLNLKGLQDIISVSVVHPLFQRTRPDDPNDTHNGWAFVDPEVTPSLPGPTGIGKYSSKGCSPDPVMNAKFVRDLYEFAKTAPTRFSVPLLWDKHTNTVVSNESADMVRMFNTEFEDLAPSKINLYPSALRNEIDEVNEWVTEHINNGVYKVGFATTQQGYDTAVRNLYTVVDRMEEILSKQRYLVGSQITEADLRLFETLIRFDEVYVVQFKANGKLIQDYPNLFNYLKDLYQVPEIGATVNMDHIKSSYFGSQLNMNPFGIVPAGPNVDYASPHDRDRFSK